MSDFVVDLGALGEVATRLADIHDVLDCAADDLTARDTAMASARAVDAWEGFVSGWSDGREKIATEIASLRDAVVDAAVEYAQSEQAVPGGFGGGGRPATAERRVAPSGPG